MIKYIQLSVFFLFSNFCYSQIYYSNYLDETCQWKYNNVAATPFYIEKMYRTVYYEGTVNYNGYTYYKEKFLTLFEYYDYNGSFVSSTLFNPLEYNLIREDATGKIYRRPYAQLDTEVLVLDNQTIINAQVGDNLPSTPDFFFGICEILTINTITIDDLSLKHLIGAGGPATGIVEGIGVVSQSCASGGSLVCFSKQGETVQFQPIECDLFPSPEALSIPDLQLTKVLIFPNPISSSFTIKSNKSMIKKIKLCDVQGRILKIVQLNQMTSVINISDFAKGTYIVLIEIEEGVVKEKIIKH